MSDIMMYLLDFGKFEYWKSKKNLYADYVVKKKHPGIQKKKLPGIRKRDP